MKDWETIADKLSKAGWSWGCVSAVDSEGQTIWIKTQLLGRIPVRQLVSRAGNRCRGNL
jgi:hypothetical protein